MVKPGKRMRLIPLSEVRGPRPRFEEIVEGVRRALGSGRVPPLFLDREKNVIGNEWAYAALWALGTGYAPVAESESELGREVELEALDLYRGVVGDPARVYDSVAELAARDSPTPLVRLRSFEGPARAWAKLEWYHPFSLSIKDRIATAMLLDAIERGLLRPGDRIYEPTSTNTGLGLVGLGNFLGIGARVYLPSTAQKCVDYLFGAMGAEVMRKDTPITTAMIGEVLEEARRDGAAVLNQFDNDMNLVAHLRGTAKEIDYQLRSRGIRPSAIVAGMGTSGHISALSLYFKSRYGGVKVYGVQPSQGSAIPGIRRVETGMKWVHGVEVDEIIDISLEEAFAGVLYVARKDGILLGLSAGAAAYALAKLAEEGKVSGDVVMVAPDHGIKYIEIIESLIARACPEDSAFK